MRHEDERALLERARTGDEAALNALIERYEAQVYRFGMKMCRHPEDARDVLQETLLALARSVRELRGASSLSTWLYTVARSYCIKHRRRRKDAPSERQVGPETELSTLTDERKLPDEALADKQLTEAIERALGTLDPAQREVLILRDIEGLAASEVAQVVGASVQAVKSRLHRARLALREAVAPLLAVPSEPTSAHCPDVLNQFSRFLEGDIDATACARMQQHVDGCPRCAGVCDSLKRTLALCKTGRSDEPIPPEVQAQVRAAVREVLNPPRT